MIDLNNLIGFPLDMAKKIIGDAKFCVEITGKEIPNGTIVVTKVKKQDEILHLTCSWFVLNLGR
ncbi:MAG: hypothetical protein WCR30_00030 [Clostridia bacterium]